MMMREVLSTTTWLAVTPYASNIRHDHDESLISRGTVIAKCQRRPCNSPNHDTTAYCITRCGAFAQMPAINCARYACLY